MKKSITSLMALLMVLTLCVSFTSCKNDDADVDDELIYGTWKSYTVRGNYDSSERLYLPSKGKGTWSTSTGSREFKYSYNNNKLTMTFNDETVESYKVELLTNISLNIVKVGESSDYYRYKFERQ